jgi:hypothetical protein
MKIMVKEAMLTLTGEEILALEVGGNDAGAKTIGQYLVDVLRQYWRDGDDFDPSSPFGASFIDWRSVLEQALIVAGAVNSEVDRAGIERYNTVVTRSHVDALIDEAIRALYNGYHVEYQADVDQEEDQ